MSGKMSVPFAHAHTFKNFSLFPSSASRESSTAVKKANHVNSTWIHLTSSAFCFLFCFDFCRFPSSLSENGYRLSTIRMILTNVSHFVCHVKNHFLDESKLKSADMEKILLAVKRLKSNAKAEENTG